MNPDEFEGSELKLVKKTGQVNFVTDIDSLDFLWLSRKFPKRVSVRITLFPKSSYLFTN